MNGLQRNGQHLDFTNPKVQQWLKDCPYEITSLQQLMFEPKDKKQVELVVEIPVDECAVNFQYYGLSLGAKTKELEERYEKIDAEYKKLIVKEVRERNPVKLLALEERTSKLFKQMRGITKELRALIEAEKTGVQLYLSYSVGRSSIHKFVADHKKNWQRRPFLLPYQFQPQEPQ